jgi:hypothetical protein
METAARPSKSHILLGRLKPMMQFLSIKSDPISYKREFNRKIGS